MKNSKITNILRINLVTGSTTSLNLTKQSFSRPKTIFLPVIK